MATETLKPRTMNVRLASADPRALAERLKLEALVYARYTYRRHQELAPAIFFVDGSNDLSVASVPYFKQGGFSREVLAGMLNAVLREHGATAYLFLLEMWVRLPTNPEDAKKFRELLAQNPGGDGGDVFDRLVDAFPSREILALNIVAGDIKEFKAFNIIRDKHGYMKSLNEPDMGFLSTSDSWMLHLLDITKTVH